MVTLIGELMDQSRALRHAADFYLNNPNLLDLSKKFLVRRLVLTGMGASYHAACIAGFHLQSLGMQAVAVEALDLFNYSAPFLGAGDILIYISQSGSSGEVLPLLDRLDKQVVLVGITNQTESPLAQHAQATLPILAGDETLVATKTYINTLAILWLLARQTAGVFDGQEASVLETMACRVEAQMEERSSANQLLLDTFAECSPLVFTGHGPHGVTARQSAMVLSEWAKLPALHFGIGAFRHGYIEIIQSGMGAVVFAPPGRTGVSAQALARDLQAFGAVVMLVENGQVRRVGEPDCAEASIAPLDEFISPILDIIPIQNFTEALAPLRGFGEGFRYIGKVVKQL
jgi:glutamine---fructose-6-phosphate transaminase (isomerizing)